VVVVRRQEVGSYVVLTVTDPGGPTPAPGQFYMLAAAERWGAGADERPFLPRAFSVLRVVDDRLSFMLEDVGPGTNRLCDLGVGEELRLVGPLGQGFTAPGEERRPLLCGGGVGVAPLAVWQDALLADGVADVAVLLGFRDARHAEGASLLRGARVATDDGSVGHHGLVTALLDAELDADPHTTVYACGPPAMLEAVRARCADRGVPAQLALESGMACGYGACFGCVVPLQDGSYARVCVDGPVFAGDTLGEGALAIAHGVGS
jgi:NAD(P)H-flavin reductase